MVGVQARCAKCERKAQPGVQLIYIYDTYICGDCYIEYQGKINQKVKEDMLNG